MAYAHVQMMLYRPFLHYASEDSCAGKSIDERSYACAAACVSVSRNIVHITMEMKRRGLLIGAYWFAIYTTFFAVLSLVYFVLENPHKVGSKEILADATAGRNAIAGLAKRCLSADRCSNALGVSISSPTSNLHFKNYRWCFTLLNRETCSPFKNHENPVEKFALLEADVFKAGRIGSCWRVKCSQVFLHPSLIRSFADFPSLCSRNCPKD